MKPALIMHVNSHEICGLVSLISVFRAENPCNAS